ncbi:unnamed protein product, partial [Ectocarpus sp. 8 AP-2014]
MPPSTTRRVVLTGTNFNANGTKLYFDPPASRVTYRVLSSTRIALFVKNRNTRSTVAKNEPLRIVAIDTGAGAVQINPGDEGLFIGSISAGAEDVHRAVLFMNGLCGGEIRSTIHTKVGEQPDELTLELAEGFTWYNQGWAFLPQPLELKSVDAGKGWTQLGPTDSPGKPLTVAIVFEDPSIYASDTEIFHGYTTDLDVKGTSFRHGGTIKRGDWVYDTVPPILIFDPPIDPEVVEVVVNGYGQVTVSFQQRDDPQWAPAGYFGPLKITALDTGAGMVVLDPPVTVANVVPGSPYEFFLLKRINQLREDGAIKHHQERVNQVAREWQAMTPAEKAQFVSSTRIEISCMAMGCFVAEPGQLKVVAIDTGAGLVRLNPEDGGVVVATVKPHITVQQDENLLIYQSTKQIRIGGSGFEEDMEA